MAVKEKRMLITTTANKFSPGDHIVKEGISYEVHEIHANSTHTSAPEMTFFGHRVGAPRHKLKLTMHPGQEIVLSRVMSEKNSPKDTGTIEIDRFEYVPFRLVKVSDLAVGQMVREKVGSEFVHCIIRSISKSGDCRDIYATVIDNDNERVNRTLSNSAEVMTYARIRVEGNEKQNDVWGGLYLPRENETLLYCGLPCRVLWSRQTKCWNHVDNQIQLLIELKEGEAAELINIKGIAHNLQTFDAQIRAHKEFLDSIDHYRHRIADSKYLDHVVDLTLKAMARLAKLAGKD